MWTPPINESAEINELTQRALWLKVVGNEKLGGRESGYC